MNKRNKSNWTVSKEKTKSGKKRVKDEWPPEAAELR